MFHTCSEGDRPFDRFDNIGQGDRSGWPRELEPAADAPGRAQQSRSGQPADQLLHGGCWQPSFQCQLRSIDARHLFKSTHMNVVVRNQGYLRGYMQTFIRMFAPHVSKVDLDGALRGVVPLAREQLPRAPGLRR